MERGVAVFERRVIDLADPLQHEGHRGDAIAAIEKRLDDQLKRFGRIELVDEHSPEFDVARGSARFVPGAQGPGHEIRRDFDFLADESFDAADAGRGVLVPPGGESIEGGGENLFVCGVVDRGRFGPGAGTKIENLLDQLDQIVDAKIVNRVFDRRERG